MIQDGGRILKKKSKSRFRAGCEQEVRSTRPEGRSVEAHAHFDRRNESNDDDDDESDASLPEKDRRRRSRRLGEKRRVD